MTNKSTLEPKQWLTLNANQLIRNLEVIKDNLGRPLIAVCKANCYGHGAAELIPIMRKQGITEFAFYHPEEVLSLSFRPGERLMLWGEVTKEEFIALQQHQAKFGSSTEFTVASFADINHLGQLSGHHGSPINVVFALDLMGREGFLYSELQSAFEEIQKHDGLLKISQIYGHLGAQDKPEFQDDNRQKIILARDGVAIIKELLGSNPKIQSEQELLISVASSNSVALPQDIKDLFSFTNRTRCGLWCYYPPIELSGTGSILTWQAKIKSVRVLPTNYYVGYGNSYRTTKPTRIAIISVGYINGLSRFLSNKGYLTCEGNRLPIIGNVSMNMCTVELPDDDKDYLGKTVTLLGGEGMSAGEVEELTGVIPYQVFTDIDGKIAKIVQ